MKVLSFLAKLLVVGFCEQFCLGQQMLQTVCLAVRLSNELWSTTDPQPHLSPTTLPAPCYFTIIELSLVNKRVSFFKQSMFLVAVVFV